MPRLQGDGLQLAYATLGSGTPFLFQHGLGADATQPARQTPEACRLITLECRGHGASPVGDEGALGFETYAHDAAALLDRLGLDRVVAGGISMGAGVATSIARLYPKRVRALVLVRPAWLDRAWPDNLAVFGEIAALLRQHDPLTAKSLFTAQSAEYRRIQGLSRSAADSLIQQFDRPYACERAAVLERLPGDRPLLPDHVSAPAMPILILAAQRDPMHPYALAVALRDRLPGAVLRDVPSKDDDTAAHQDAVAAAIADFLTTLEPRRPPRALRDMAS